MKILITGSTGLVGRNLTSVLKNSGYELILFKGDITKKVDFEQYKSVKNIEAVIHLAGTLKGKNKEKYFSVNCDGTKNVINFCKSQNVGRLIYFSSIKVLSKLSDPYADSKRCAEKAVTESNLPYIIIRPSLVYGPDDDKNIGLIISLAKKLPLVPASNFNLQPIYIDDLIKATQSCLEKSPNQIFNLVGLEDINPGDILKILKEHGFKFIMLNSPTLFNFFIKLLAILPFSPLPYWQVKSMLAGESFKGDYWPELFNIKPTLFKEGISKCIK